MMAEEESLPHLGPAPRDLHQTRTLPQHTMPRFVVHDKMDDPPPQMFQVNYLVELPHAAVVL
jgi:hypothetical protein